MRINKNQVMEINLKDLFFYLLYRWRSILAAALIGAIALCGYQYLSIKKAHDAGELTKDERQYQINVQQYKEELASNRNMVTVYTKLLREQNDYLDNSIYIKLSPNNVYIARNSYLIKADQSVRDALPQGSSMDPVDSILPAYAAPLAEQTRPNMSVNWFLQAPIQMRIQSQSMYSAIPRKQHRKDWRFFTNRWKPLQPGKRRS